jgi:putative FmdB family regulatory protein
MPTYEYHCQACKHRFDELQSFSEPELKKCPKCKKNKLKRAFGVGAAVLFKGSGFYQTDYRSQSYQSAAQAEQQAAKTASEKPTSSEGGSTSATPSANGSVKSSEKAKGGKEAKAT